MTLRDYCKEEHQWEYFMDKRVRLCKNCRTQQIKKFTIGE